MQNGSAAAALAAMLATGVGVTAIYLGHPVFGMSAWILVDAAFFAVMAWRVYRLSLPWAIAGLLFFTVGRIFGILNNPHLLIGGLAGLVVFFPCYLNAVRGGFYLRRANSEGSVPIPLIETNAAPEGEISRGQATEAQQSASGGSTAEEYEEFLNCMRRGDRKFQKPGFTVQQEFGAWLKDRRRKLAISRPAEEKARATRPA
jgi:hypothetical protein